MYVVCMCNIKKYKDMNVNTTYRNEQGGVVGYYS